MAEQKKDRSQALVGGAIVAVIVALSVVLYASPGYLFPSAGGVIFQTVTSTETVFRTETGTTSVIQTTTVQATSFVTVTIELPPSVTVEGSAHTNNPATSASAVSFKSQDSGDIYRVDVRSGRYFLLVPNRAVYTVSIAYSITPVGSGECTVGSLLLNTIDNQVTADISC